jgi:thiol:disulfide interchange protein DsbD
MALATIYTFAMFPGWLHSLPKSGGWLNTVKLFRILELALAFLIKCRLGIAVVEESVSSYLIAIFGTLAFYLFGKITLPHDSPLTHISVGRLMLGLLALTLLCI